MREKLIVELVKEVLGPRTANIRETIDISPVSEFITGVLAPIVDQVTPELDDESDIPSEDTQTYEEGTAEEDINAPPIFQPALDPKNKPSTMGLSFVVKCDESPKIDVCLTWARYKGIEGDKGRIEKWQREPKSSVLSIELISNQTFWIDSLGNISNQDNAEISFHVIIHSLQSSLFLVHLYIVNRLSKPDELEVTSDCCVFQPQIRVCRGNTRIVPGIRKIPRGEEEQGLELMYRKRQVYARGHLCSAMWNEIDPQIAPEANFKIDFPDSVKEMPFFWLDGLILEEKNLQAQHKLFSSPDVRTEFVPLYAIMNPKLDWPVEFKNAPELSANKLAEIWDIKDVQNAFFPITQEFEQWISNLEKEKEGFSQRERIIADELIFECKTVSGRIKDGINILCDNKEARLAFCFANKAITTQWWWSKKNEYRWRPFQIAFILMTIESILNPKSKFRNTCDALWVPTGTGKTEAYLALIAFTNAYRRRKALIRTDQELSGAGVSVITRYTLRLLTIQQFRRTLSLITACEYLRVFNLLEKKSVGWRPTTCTEKGNFIWGSTPFSCGLWVGGGVSPNRLKDKWVVGFEGKKLRLTGALSILSGDHGEGEPAQVLTCPSCDAVLAVPEMGLQAGKHEIHFIIRLVEGNDVQKIVPLLEGNKFNEVTVLGKPVFSSLESASYYALTLNLDVAGPLTGTDMDSFWESIQTAIEKNGIKVELSSIRASRNGYFERYYDGKERIGYDFEIFCPNPKCDLNKHWCGGLPSGWITDNDPHNLGPSPDGHVLPFFPDGNRLMDVQKPFRRGGSIHISDRIPIPALTVEDQIFCRLPSVVVATVDKFARPPFEPRAASLFGNVDFHHCIYGYFRDVQEHPSPAGTTNKPLFTCLPHRLLNPDLIIQDELHLIEGPLGSMVGLYETAIDFLCEETRGDPVKYIASTATIRRALEQTKAIFSREIQLFPPHGLTSDDKFFIKDREVHALDDKSPGRLYLGICAPGRGPLTPLVRIWSRLLHVVGQNSSNRSVDDFWTLTGYFNAIRELGGARALYRQDIPQRLQKIVEQEHTTLRQLDDDNAIELSSRRNATDLPAILDILKRPYPNAPDALFTTSMFGTGIDIPRIGLMVVNGQPKTTSSYIQSTGRVGRRGGALVVTFLRASRPRDLNHYEFFAGYHRQLHRFVEPATVYPFSPGCLDRALGPAIVFILRNMRNCTVDWGRFDSAPAMATQLCKAPEVQNLSTIFEDRAQTQPRIRRPVRNTVSKAVKSKLATWQSIAMLDNSLRYVEYAINTKPQFPVVLGDYQHLHAHKEVVYENAPLSLRDIEETTGFQTKNR